MWSTSSRDLTSTECSSTEAHQGRVCTGLDFHRPICLRESKSRRVTCLHYIIQWKKLILVTWCCKNHYKNLIHDSPWIWSLWYSPTSKILAPTNWITWWYHPSLINLNTHRLTQHSLPIDSHWANTYNIPHNIIFHTCSNTSLTHIQLRNVSAILTPWVKLLECISEHKYSPYML